MEIVVLANKYKSHHFKNLEKHFVNRFIYEESYNPEKILQHNPDLVICFDEHWCELGYAISAIRKKGIATLQVMDGILEWRRTWDYEWEGHKIDGVINPINQPVLSHKIACLGKTDTRILESWGNFGKCEIIGAARLDHLLHKYTCSSTTRKIDNNKKKKILVMTAKKAGFTRDQILLTTKALIDLNSYFNKRKDIDVIWRVTQDLDTCLGIKNTLSDFAGKELHTILENVDAVITTPSTSLIEAMLINKPVSLIDYHNCPHYFEAAWNIFSQNHIDQVVNELLNPPLSRIEYQNFLLSEHLVLLPDATNRLTRLIEEMLKIKKQSNNMELLFPIRIIDDKELFNSNTVLRGEFSDYYPEFPISSEKSKKELELELSSALGTIFILNQKYEYILKRLYSIPGFRFLKKIFQRYFKEIH